MKKQLMLLMVLGLSVGVGCSDGTSGGPGATTTDSTDTVNSANRPTYGEADNTFSLDVPELSTSIKQGESDTVTIGLNRGDNFQQDVTLKLSGLPEGVTAEPAEPKVLASDEEVEILFTAGADAAVGDFTVNVTGHPATGADAKADLKLTITDNE